MNNRNQILDRLVAVMMAVSIVFLTIAVTGSHRPGDTQSSALKVEKRINGRMAKLDQWADKLLKNGNAPIQIPSDMVLYRYYLDSLQSWNNQFTVSEDGIESKVVIQRLVNPRMEPQSKLSDIGDSIGFFNFGPNWYLAKSVTKGNVKVLEGLMISSSLDRSSYNGVNPALRLSGKYSVKPLEFSGGSAVEVGGKPQFKILYDSLKGTPTTDSNIVWIALAFFIVGSILFLSNKRTINRFLLVVSGISLSFLAMYIWGWTARNEMMIFSPKLYAGGSVLFSLGAVLEINMAIVLLVYCTYLVRSSIPSSLCKLAYPGMALVCYYAQMAFRSVVLNSGICLEMYKYSELSSYSFIVLASFLLLLLTIPLSLKIAGIGRISNRLRIVISSAVALWFVCSGSLLSYRKEKAGAEVLANMLSVGRDLTLEMKLMNVERQIATDPILASLTAVPGQEGAIRNRLYEMYFPRESQLYNITVSASGELDYDLRGSEPISAGSHFGYIEAPGGVPSYAGVFFYNIDKLGVTRLVIMAKQRKQRASSGFASLLSLEPPGQVNLQKGYSYALYRSGKLLRFSGDYAYPTTFNPQPGENGYTHFVNDTLEGETVIISRRTHTVLNYLVEFIAIALLFFVLMAVPATGDEREYEFDKLYFRSRILLVVMSSLILTLVALLVISVLFVYSRNESNLNLMMSDKLNSVQSLIDNTTRSYHKTEELRSLATMRMLERVGNITSTDITLYSPEGQMFLSTDPQVFESMALGSRMDMNAYKAIVRDGKRYHIQKERLGAISYRSMYAPLLSADGNILAILAVPYTEENYDFEKDAISHAITLVIMFLILLLLARFLSRGIVDRMFKPLSEIGRRMDTMDLDKLEPIRYDRDDEIRSLVDAYNRMVEELSKSTVKLAEAERDKAWSGMARQVAHEIKNPLTPMKLQLQRIIRLKEKNAPDWQEKFDEMASILLDHIDILTDTANEFSTFAKLYTEEAVEFDLDRVLQEEISMFDSKENVSFDYVGFKGAVVKGPKPQLTRVFVNLINNAVQAVSETESPKVMVSLRNSGEDGYFDIVFEDNGPGVSAENQGKLFTPNFTTKNGGSGLGLAISRSILQRCDASIAYSKSFSLSGACFTVHYPKK